MDQLRAWHGRIDKLATDTKVMSDRLRELQVTVADDNGLAEVTVDSTGALLGLRLGRQTQRVSPEVVAQAVMNALRRAKEQLAERSQQIIAETVGTESTAARAIADRVGRQLRPDPEPGWGEPGSHDGQGWRR
ncbi:YbaB/EbfC family nucleoid-associated protein [Micromonospora sp. NPDC053740]